MPTQPGRVLVVGSLNADLTVRTSRFPKPGETISGSDLVISPGGKSANQAAAVGLLGGDVAILGNIGDDEFGEMLRARLVESQVDVTHLDALPDVASGTASITVAEDGENCIIISPGANGRLTADQVAAAADFFDSAGEGSVLTLCLEVALDAVTTAAREAHARGVTVALNLSPFQPIEGELMQLTDVLVVNAHELADLVGLDEVPLDESWDEVVATTRRAVGEDGPRHVVVTLGGDGARTMDLREGTASQRLPSVRLQPVDTTGCGDALLAGLAFRLAAGDSMEDAVGFGIRVGGYAALGRGAQDSYPTADQLENWRPEDA